METPGQLKAYAEMIREGITAWRLKGDYEDPDGFWTQEFETFGPLPREACKEYCIRYLQSAYNADSITFLVRPSHNAVQFYAQFKRGDL